MAMSEASDIVSDSHWTVKEFRQRVTKKELQAIRLTEAVPWFRNGEACSLKHRHVGVGVYEIWLVPIGN